MLKTTQPKLLALILWLSVTPLFLSAKISSDKGKFEELSEQLNEAIESRNFQEARTTMEELMPLMKEVLKEDKKQLANLKKEDNPTSDPEEFEKKLERKTELYNTLRKLVDVSPAALRGKSRAIKEGVTEFVELS